MILSSYGGDIVYSIFDLIDSALDPATPILHVGGVALDRHRVEAAHRPSLE